MTRVIFHIMRPITLWGLHFIAVYALISAACAQRGLLDIDTMRLVALGVTAAFVVIALVWLGLAVRSLRAAPDTHPERQMALAAFWSGVISTLGLLANAWPILTLSHCAG